jgi:hypothetical protein
MGAAMRTKSILAFCVAMFTISAAYAAEPSLSDQLKIIKQGDVEKKDDKVIEKYYYEKETIKEVPQEQSQDEKHLWTELKDKLKKTKKVAEIWRVEDDLIEIDKGAIHKVREGDVYEIYGKNGKYKGKMEVGAIADAVSIGESISGRRGIEKGDIAEYIGQRRFWGSGLLYGNNIASSETADSKKYYQSYGLYWRFLFLKGWGIGAAIAMTEMKPLFLSDSMLYRNKVPDAWRQYSYESNKWQYALIRYEGQYRIYGPIDVRKYFFHPRWYTSYIGAGIASFRSTYRLYATSFVTADVNGSNSIVGSLVNADVEGGKNTIIPALAAGTELSFGTYLKFVISANYFHGPNINIQGYKEFTRPLMLTAAIIGTW